MQETSKAQEAKEEKIPKDTKTTTGVDGMAVSMGEKVEGERVEAN